VDPEQARSGDAIDELGTEGAKIPPDRITDPFEKLLPGYKLNRDPERVSMRRTTRVSTRRAVAADGT
jgi:hypothetical protein